MNNSEFEQMVKDYSAALLKAAARAQPAVEEVTPEDSGELKVTVTTARGMFPLGGARVTAFMPDKDGGYTELKTVYSDNSGIADGFILPANAYGFDDRHDETSGYMVKVTHPGYVDFVFPELEVFAGVVSVLPADLLPDTGEVI